MRPDDIFEAMSDVSDRHIEQKKPGRAGRVFMRFAAAAAALALIVVTVLPRMGGRAGESGAPESTEAEQSVPESFMSYAGAMLPLTALSDGLSAERSVTLDFSDWSPVWHSIDDLVAELPDSVSDAERAEARAQYEEWYPDGGYYSSGTDVLVRDSYVLHGGDGETALVMPFVSSFRYLDEHIPTLAQNGELLAGELFAGDLAGYYAGEGYGSYDYSSGISGWGDLKAVLSSGEYMRSALDGGSAVADTPVIVYRVEDVSVPPESEENLNPTVELSFTLDYDATTVWSWGFNGGSWDAESGTMSRNFSGGHGEGYSRMLIVMGEDITEPVVTGYRTGDCSEGNELEGVSARVVRCETTLGEVVRETMIEFIDKSAYIQFGENDFEERLELICSVAMRTLERYHELGAYIWEDFETVYGDILAQNRVFFLVCETELSEGDTVTAEYLKDASFDYYCAHTEKQGVSGYELAVSLGSGIEMRSLTARLENFGHCEIAGGSFGFDVENGVTEVALDPAAEVYYIEVRRG